MRLYFSEVEHDGDVASYAGEIAGRGVTVCGRGVGGPSGDEPDGDTGWVEISYAEDGWSGTASLMMGLPCLDFLVGKQRVPS